MADFDDPKPDEPAPQQPTALSPAEELRLLRDWAASVDSNLAKLLPDVLRRLDRLEEQISDAQLDSGERVLGDLLKHIKGYTNLLLALGYGGILAIWSDSGDVMAAPAFIGAGAAVILSLLLFIGGEVYQTRILVETLRKPLDSMPSELEKAKKRADSVGRILYWPVLALGFGGGFTMFLCYVGNLMAEAAKAWG